MAQSFTDKLNQQRQEYNDAIRAGKVIGAAGLAMPPGFGTALSLANDQKIQQMEEENPSLVTNPFDARRYSTVGQVLFGYGYPQQTGIPRVGAWDRLKNSLGIGGDGMPNPATNMWNAKGVRINIVNPGAGAPVTSGGWETGGGGDGPAAAQGTSNFGGRESAIDNNDYSGYA